MEKLIKDLHGHSNSRIMLISDGKNHFVRKMFNVDRNLERMQALSTIIKMPKIIDSSYDCIDMEYIKGLDICNFLLYNKPDKLIEFIIDTLDKFSVDSTIKDYTEIYHDKLSQIDFQYFPFTIEELLNRLPKEVPQSLYHGDFTLDNIIYKEDEDTFYMIDPLTSEYDSYVFDIAKLNQDLICGWFNRNIKVNLGTKMKIIHEAISYKYDCATYNIFTIIMLLRVFPYCRTKHDQSFIINNVESLWI